MRSTHVMQAIRILTSCALAYAAAWLVMLPDRFWALITAIVVTQPVLTRTLEAGRDRVLGTLVGALAGLLVIEATHFGLPLQPLFWVTMVPLALVSAIWPNLRLSCITLTVVVLVPSTGLSFSQPLDRVMEILLGTLASIVVALVFQKAD